MASTTLSLDDIRSRKDYMDLSEPERGQVDTWYYKEHLQGDPDFIKLSEKEKYQVFDALKLNTDILSSHPASTTKEPIRTPPGTTAKIPKTWLEGFVKGFTDSTGYKSVIGSIQSGARLGQKAWDGYYSKEDISDDTLRGTANFAMAIPVSALGWVQAVASPFVGIHQVAKKGLVKTGLNPVIAETIAAGLTTLASLGGAGGGAVASLLGKSGSVKQAIPLLMQQVPRTLAKKQPWIRGGRALFGVPNQPLVSGKGVGITEQRLKKLIDRAEALEPTYKAIPELNTASLQHPFTLAGDIVESLGRRVDPGLGPRILGQAATHRALVPVWEDMSRARIHAPTSTVRQAGGRPSYVGDLAEDFDSPISTRVSLDHPLLTQAQAGAASRAAARRAAATTPHRATPTTPPVGPTVPSVTRQIGPQVQRGPQVPPTPTPVVQPGVVPTTPWVVPTTPGVVPTTPGVVPRSREIVTEIGNRVRDNIDEHIGDLYPLVTDAKKGGRLYHNLVNMIEDGVLGGGEVERYLRNISKIRGLVGEKGFNVVRKEVAAMIEDEVSSAAKVLAPLSHAARKASAHGKSLAGRWQNLPPKVAKERFAAYKAFRKDAPDEFFTADASKIIDDFALEPTGLDKWVPMGKGLEHFSRVLGIAAPVTATRNAIQGAGTFSFGLITEAISGTMNSLLRTGGNKTPYYSGLIAMLQSVWRRTSKQQRKVIEEIIDSLPGSRLKLLGTPLGNVVMGRVGRFVNILNILQEDIIRKTTYEGMLLGGLSKIKGLPELLAGKKVGKGGGTYLDVRQGWNSVTKNKGWSDKFFQLSNGDPNSSFNRANANAIRRAREVTFAAEPNTQAGKGLLKLFSNPFMTALGNPFPRFFANNLRYLYEHSPLPFARNLWGNKEGHGFLRSLANTRNDPKAISKFFARNNEKMSKATMGVVYLAAAYAIRDAGFSGNKYYEIKALGKTWDLRPFPPFVTYLFMIDAMRDAAHTHILKTPNYKPLLTAKDYAEGMLGVGRWFGTGFAALDAFNKIKDTSDTNQLFGWFRNFGGSWSSRLTRPLRGWVGEPIDAAKSLLTGEKAPPMEVDDKLQTSLLGVPGIRERVGKKQVQLLREDPGMTGGEQSVRLLTGFAGRELNNLEEEFSSLRMDAGQMYLKRYRSRNLARIVSKEAQKLIKVGLAKDIEKPSYKALSEFGKRQHFKKRLSETKSQAWKNVQEKANALLIEGRHDDPLVELVLKQKMYLNKDIPNKNIDSVFSETMRAYGK